MGFLEKIVTIGTAIVIALIVIFKVFAALLTHWFILAIVIGVAVFIFAGQNVNLSISAVIISAIVLGLLNLFVNDDPVQEERTKIEERYRERKQEEEDESNYRRDRESEERNRREQERQEKERQERLRQEQLERERQERLRQERERQERERKSKEAEEVYNKIFTDYYKAISEHRFSDAYSLLSEKEQQHQGSLENFSEGRKDTAEIKVLSFEITKKQDTMVFADYQIRTKDTDKSGSTIRTFNGNVTFIKSAGTWKIDSLSSKKVDERRE